MNKITLVGAGMIVALGGCQMPQTRPSVTRLPVDLHTYQRLDTVHYTGTGYLRLLAGRPHYSLVSFVFEPGGRNRWHLHPGAEQVMYVTQGEGYYQQKGQPKRLLRAGDVVVVPPDTRHWNGATPTSRVVLMTISDHVEQDHVTWFEQVSEEEFRR
ncbi:cupin domain-containing protein [Hymenobacter perfusus]|nr:cupin domain-containing protein [Hymenobacter perfusus]